MLALSIVFLALVYAWVSTKDKKRLKAICNIQSQTEEAEALNFQINLYESDTDGQITQKIMELFSIAEGRRAFNNERMRAQMQAAQEEAKRTLESLKK